MNTEIICPKSEAEWLDLRKKDITSTEVGALVGLSDSSYIPTRYELGHRKKHNLTSDFEPNDRVKWGQRLQDSIAAGIAQDQKWDVRRMNEYLRIPDIRLGASFDFSIEAPGSGLLEIKNVDSLIFRDKWVINEDGSVEAPPSIELQVQHQLAVSGRSYAYIAALIGGNRVVLIKRDADPQIADAIKREAAAFWKSIDDNVEPSPDFRRDADVISRLCGYAEPGKIFDARSDEKISSLLQKHKLLGDQAKLIEEERDAIKAQILLKIGDAEKVEGNGFTISCGIIGECPVSYIRKAYRMFKPNWPRTKK
jgi:putative phage-type endonuclease